jgi:hypothetical protein
MRACTGCNPNAVETEISETHGFARGLHMLFHVEGGGGERGEVCSVWGVSMGLILCVG